MIPYYDESFKANENVESEPSYQPVLKVVGLGGGGCNAIERMIELGVRGVEFIAANTDLQTLVKNPAESKILLGPKTTRGFGAGGDPRLGREAAWESKEEISAALRGADMVFLTAGMGGGTGTGSIPVVAEMARALGAVTIAIVTTPFSFEMGKRQKNAREGLEELRKHTHTLISIPNDRLLYVAPKDLPMETAFRLADDVLRQAVQGIAELITEPGLINVDFAHIRRLISLGGGALMSIGHGQGVNKTAQALEQALNHPLLEDVYLEHAAGMIVNFTGGDDLTLVEVQEAVNSLLQRAGAQTEMVLGVIQDERMQDRVQVILVITGLGAPTLEQAVSSLEQLKQIERPMPAVETDASADFVEDTSHEENVLHSLPQPKHLSMSIPPTNYDLPAFLRRRMTG